jgi:hypothetical protein
MKKQNRPNQKPSVVARAQSTIVFCGDAEQVSEGFALALEAMDANADLLMRETLPKQH